MKIIINSYNELFTEQKTLVSDDFYNFVSQYFPAKRDFLKPTCSCSHKTWFQ